MRTEWYPVSCGHGWASPVAATICPGPASSSKCLPAALTAESTAAKASRCDPQLRAKPRVSAQQHRYSAPRLALPDSTHMKSSVIFPSGRALLSRFDRWRCSTLHYQIQPGRVRALAVATLTHAKRYPDRRPTTTRPCLAIMSSSGCHAESSLSEDRGRPFRRFWGARRPAKLEK